MCSKKIWIGFVFYIWSNFAYLFAENARPRESSANELSASSCQSSTAANELPDTCCQSNSAAANRLSDTCFRGRLPVTHSTNDGSSSTNSGSWSRLPSPAPSCRRWHAVLQPVKLSAARPANTVGSGCGTESLLDAKTTQLSKAMRFELVIDV